MKKTTSIVALACVCLLGFQNTFAQYYTKANSKWFFGYQAGLDFSSGRPVNFVATNLNSDEGAAGVCDLNGNTLFYTDGTSAYNRQGAVMQNGNKLTPFNTYGSCTQAAQIVQNIGNLNQYYVFSLQEDVHFVNPGDVDYGRLCYSMVDMTLDSGKGGVLATEKSIMLDSSLSEKMIAIPGNNCNVWLITHSRDAAIFYAREVSATGIGLPVVSNVGTRSALGAYMQGVMSYSPDRTKIAMYSYQTGGTDRALELFSFDPITGMVSNAQTIDNIHRGYGCEFSPDSKRLYAQEGLDSTVKVVQYNCTLPSAAAIQASKSIVFEDTSRYGIFSLKLAPDNKIYLIAKNTDSLDCIAAPNNIAAMCGYTKNAVGLYTGTRAVYGLPNVYTTADTSCAIIRRLNTPLTQLSGTLSAFPNPATTVVTIATPAATGTITVCDMIGRQLLNVSVTTATTTIDTRSLMKGLYTVSYTDATGAANTQKVIVE
jgi:hypothetical protein